MDRSFLTGFVSEWFAAGRRFVEDGAAGVVRSLGLVTSGDLKALAGRVAEIDRRLTSIADRRTRPPLRAVEEGTVLVSQADLLSERDIEVESIALVGGVREDPRVEFESDPAIPEKT